MRPHFTLLLLSFFAFSVLPANAQWIRVWQNGESTRYAVADAASLPYSANTGTLTIGDVTYNTADIDSLTIVNPVAIIWDGNNATVDVPESVEGLTVTVDGGNVNIFNDNIFTEQEFVLSGTSDSGSLTYVGAFKCKFHLAGLNLTSTTGAALDIQCGKRVDLILEDGTLNVLSDYAAGEQRAALNCQGHLEISGAGALEISGNARHALRAKEYLLLKRTLGVLAINTAASDGIHCGEYFQMNGGTLIINNTLGDGLQVETDAESDETLNGQFIMNGGTIDLTVTAPDSKGIRLDAVEGNSTLVPAMYLLDGTITANVAATALGSKAIASDGNLTIGSDTTAPTINITVGAGTYTDPDTDEENRATGLKAEQTLTIAGGETTVAATGAKSRGVRAATLIATGGTLTVTNTGSKSQGIKLDNTFQSGQGGTVNGKFKY